MDKGLKVLAPLDKSSRDRIVLPQLLKLARRSDAVIHVLHVVPITRTLVPHAVRSAESYVDAFQAQLAAQGVDAHAIVRKGDPASEIVKVATEYEVDLIMMSTRGRRGLDRLLIGSVAEEVMSRCAYPVTLVNEATARSAMDDRVWAQSTYMAGVIWNKVAGGLLTEDQAVVELQRLAAMGLDHDVMHAAYAALRDAGQPSEWLDLDFQLDTLRQYLPEALAGKTAA